MKLNPSPWTDEKSPGPLRRTDHNGWPTPSLICTQASADNGAKTCTDTETYRALTRTIMFPSNTIKTLQAVHGTFRLSVFPVEPCTSGVMANPNSAALHVFRAVDRPLSASLVRSSNTQQNPHPDMAGGTGTQHTHTHTHTHTLTGPTELGWTGWSGQVGRWQGWESGYGGGRRRRMEARGGRGGWNPAVEMVTVGRRKGVGVVRWEEESVHG